MARHTPTPDTCRRLQAAGFPVAEPILTEMIQHLPRHLTADSGLGYALTITPLSTDGGWRAGYECHLQPPTYLPWLISFDHDSLLEAVAGLWLKLKEEHGSLE